MCVFWVRGCAWVREREGESERGGESSGREEVRGRERERGREKQSTGGLLKDPAHRKMQQRFRQRSHFLSSKAFRAEVHSYRSSRTTPYCCLHRLKRSVLFGVDAGNISPPGFGYKLHSTQVTQVTEC